MTHTSDTTEQLPDDGPVIEDEDDPLYGDEPCNCGGAWHAVSDHCRNWTCPGCDRTDPDCPLMLT